MLLEKLLDRTAGSGKPVLVDKVPSCIYECDALQRFFTMLQDTTRHVRYRSDERKISLLDKTSNTGTVPKVANCCKQCSIIVFEHTRNDEVPWYSLLRVVREPEEKPWIMSTRDAIGPYDDAPMLVRLHEIRIELE